MADEAAPPPGGWADVPRPPLHVRLDERQARALRVAALRATQSRGAVLRVGVAVVLAALVAVSRGTVAGLVTLVVLLLLGLVPLAIAVARVRARVAPGSSRATGYDRAGDFVFSGSPQVVLPAGWAVRVDDHDGLVTIRPRRPGALPVIALRELVTAQDEAFLRDGEAPEPVWTHEVAVTPALRHALWRAMLGRLTSWPVIVLLVLLTVVEVVIAWGLPTPWTVAFAVAPLGLALGMVPLLLLVRVRRRLPLGSTVRSGVSGGFLRLAGSSVFPAELPLDAVRAARPEGALTRVRAASGVVVVLPTDLVPDDLVRDRGRDR